MALGFTVDVQELLSVNGSQRFSLGEGLLGQTCRGTIVASHVVHLHILIALRWERESDMTSLLMILVPQLLVA